ncbi:MAG: hypothetical protein GX629_07405 [Phycisphaerae bacterium]|nr:hypothetical protein [Phycisphaerae bacterium]
MTSSGKKYVLIAGLISIMALIVCVCLIISQNSRNMKKPDPVTGSPKQAVNFFVSNTMDGLTKKEKYEFFKDYLDTHYSTESAKSLSDALSKLSDKDVRRMQDNIIDAMAGGVLRYAENFNTATSEKEKQQIVNQLMAEVDKYDSFAHQIIDLTPNVKKNAPTSSSEAFNQIMKRLPPAEIAKMEPLLIRCAQKRLAGVASRK